MNVFIVTSPFQYLCAREALFHYAAQPNVLVVVLPVMESGQRLLQGLIDPELWHHILYTSKKNRTLAAPRCIKEIQRIAGTAEVERLFYAEYRSWLTNLFRRNLAARHEIYFDDGTATLIEYEAFIRPDIPFYRPALVKDTLLRAQGVIPIGRLAAPASFELFTIFDLHDAPWPCTRNWLSKLAGELGSDSVYRHEAPAGFIGQGAIGSNGPRPNAYLDIIRRFQEHVGQRLIYFPHRSEPEFISERIRAMPGVVYHYPKRPVELEIERDAIRLSALGGIASTALYTASLLYRQLPVYCREIQPGDYPEKDLHKILAIQKYYRHANMVFFQ